MSKDKYPNQSLIKQDIIEIVEEVVGRVVGEIMANALQLIATQFEQTWAITTRIENKLDATIEIVESHSAQLRVLNLKAGINSAQA